MCIEIKEKNDIYKIISYLRRFKPKTPKHGRYPETVSLDWYRYDRERMTIWFERGFYKAVGLGWLKPIEQSIDEIAHMLWVERAQIEGSGFYSRQCLTA